MAGRVLMVPACQQQLTHAHAGQDGLHGSLALSLALCLHCLHFQIVCRDTAAATKLLASRSCDEVRSKCVARETVSDRERERESERGWGRVG